MSDIIASGNLEAIISFLKEKNLLNRNLFKYSDIYWLLNSKEHYQKLIPIFREKGMYDCTIWSYAYKHHDLEAIKEHFNSESQKSPEFSSVLSYFQSEYLETDNFKLLEYFPLINPRTHSITENKKQILNKEFEKTYKNFLSYLFIKR